MDGRCVYKFVLMFQLDPIQEIYLVLDLKWLLRFQHDRLVRRKKSELEDQK